MKAYTVMQPWAWATLVHGKIENRSWRPPADLMGERIAIHAGKVSADLSALSFMWDRFGIEVPDQLPLGAIIGTVQLVGLVELRKREGKEDQVFIHDRRPGFYVDDTRLKWLMDPKPGKRAYGWVFAHPRPLATPVPCRGLQGLWDVPADLLAAIDQPTPLPEVA